MRAVWLTLAFACRVGFWTAGRVSTRLGERLLVARVVFDRWAEDARR